ncbi:MAG TPA: ATP-dependent RecD-like DNA helicase [Candidatus Aminicenantes bacterium]|nr:ATP-dependent RecD-like DNA helicase [Candidatus Aminicenantes bacterium]
MAGSDHEFSARVKIVRRVYSSPETGFGVFLASVIGHREQVTLVGTLFDVHEGDFLEVRGEETEHPRFGPQVKVASFTAILPQDTDGIAHYLSSGRFKGVGPKTAQRIVEKFGLLTFHVLENSPARLREVPGLRKAVIDALTSGIRQHIALRELTVKLAPYGIGGETIARIYREFGEQSLAVATTTPYDLIHRVRGVGFRTADAIARALALPLDAPARLAAGLRFTLDQAENAFGHLYLEEPVLVGQSARLLGVEAGLVSQALRSMLAAGELVSDPGLAERPVLTPLNDQLERWAAQRLHSLSQRPLFAVNDPDLPIDLVFQQLSITPAPEQRLAVETALRSRVSIVTGGPGTGKTTIIRAIVEVCNELHRSVLIAAPTGRAAKRIEESTGYRAQTIHRLLKFNPETGTFQHGERDPLVTDTLIIDEYSMVDTALQGALLSAIGASTRLVILGDRDQLPSVGPGNVLRDLIASDCFPTIRLQQNFRQGETSRIVENAYRIQAGQTPIAMPYAEDLDFVMLKVESDAEAVAKVAGIVRYYAQDLPVAGPDFQILVPMYRGEAGIDRINRLVQEQFNPEPEVFSRGAVAYRRGDKVMQLRNDYEREVFNGDQGRVAGYDPAERLLRVEFEGRIVSYALDDLEDITLAYAISIHKAQGSEYDLAVLLLMPSHAPLLSRELLYTAVTRARKRLILLTTDDAVARAVGRSTPTVRKTLLKTRLLEAFGDPRRPLQP